MTGNDIVMRDTDVANMDVDLWDRTMAVNLRGPMLCAKHTIPHMLKQGGGSVISTGSTKALQGDIAQTAYGASKAGVHNQIGRASCRERVCQYVYITVVAVSFKKQKL